MESVDLRKLTAARNGLDAEDAAFIADGEGPVTPGSVVLRIDRRYSRPTEVEALIGDATKAREQLGWKATVSFDELVHEMVRDDLSAARGDELLRAQGFTIRAYRE